MKTTLACLKYKYSSCPFASMVNVKIRLSSVAISFNFMNAITALDCPKSVI